MNHKGIFMFFNVLKSIQLLILIFTFVILSAEANPNGVRDEMVGAILSGSKDLPKEVEGLSIGQIVNVFNHRWVNTVGRIDPVGQVTSAVDSFLIWAGLLDKYIIADDTCSIDYGEQLEILGFSSDKTHALVKNKIGDVGASCSAGVLFFLAVDELKTFDESYEMILKQEQARDEMVGAILSGSKDLPKEVEGLSIGQIVNIPGWQWVNVVKDIEYVEKEDSCGIQKGGQLEILGFSYGADLVLVENKTGGAGTPCPEGALFFLTVDDELKTFDESYEMILKQEQARDKMVETILSGSKDLPKEVEGLSIGQIVNIPGWQWVNVVKDIVDENDSYTLEKGESCGIQKGGQLEILGFSYGADLVLVENKTGGAGTPCPEGALFFLTVDALKTFDRN